MSVDTTFKPMTPTYAVDNSAAVQVKEAQQAAVVTFRVRNINAAAIYLAWATQSAGLVAAAPTIGTPKQNTIGVPIGGVVYIEVPPGSFFVASAVAPAFEITGGQGGIGG